MKTSLEWLNSCLSEPIGVEEAQSVLTNLGLSIDHVQTLPGDAVLEVEVTSNRPDCLCHVGVAREVAAGSNRTLVTPSSTVPAKSAAGAASEWAKVRVDEPKLCPVYTARVIRGVKISASPSWLVRRLEAVGLRSVNNAVDVTNYVMLELGQPLHAFDLAQLAEKTIVVRSAGDGEPFTAINGAKFQLRKGMLVIADGKRPVAIAGVMGGLDSEVGPTTTDILLESAILDPLSVRQTSRALKLASDSSYRFERGIDPVGVELSSRRAAALIAELCGGTVAKGVIRVGTEPAPPSHVDLRIKRCRALLGLKLRGKEIVTLLGRLDLDPRPHKERKIVTCSIPSHRLDLTREVDLIEEVGRLAGLDRLDVRKKIAVVVRPVQAEVAARRRLRQILAAYGFMETVTFSFLSPAQGEPFLPVGHRPALIDDERRKAEPMLRPSLVPSLLNCRKFNQDMGNADVRLYETASVWSRQDGRMVENQRLAILADATDAEAALRELRGAMTELCTQLGGAVEAKFEPLESRALVAAAGMTLNGKSLGSTGLIEPGLLHTFALRSPVAVAELDLRLLLGLFPPKRDLQALPRFPGIERDLSIVVDEKVQWDRIEQEVRQAAPALLETIQFTAIYRGKPIKPGSKSVTIRLTFRDPEATMQHAQVDPQVTLVIERLRQGLGAELRA